MIPSSTQPMTGVQRIVFALALLSYLAAAGCVAAVLLYVPAHPNDPVRAALMATVVFFVGAGVVLHVIARSRLRGLLHFPPPETAKPAEAPRES